MLELEFVILYHIRARLMSVALASLHLFREVEMAIGHSRAKKCNLSFTLGNLSNGISEF